MSPAAYANLAQTVQQSRSILPDTFKLPSKHALRRYLEGFFAGLQKHLPFLHKSSLSVSNTPLDLILAMASTGAQYRFERQAAIELYKAARAVVQCHISESAADITFTPLKIAENLLNPSSYSPSLSPSNVSSSPVQIDPEAAKLGQTPKSVSDVKLTTIQSMIILIAFCTYNNRSLLPDGYHLSSQLVSILREGGHLEKEEIVANPSWEQWLQLEGHRRTVLMGFVVMNLASIVHHAPPILLSSEMGYVTLPRSEEEWRVSSAEEWATLRTRNRWSDITFGMSHAALFSHSPETNDAMGQSSFGNLVMIHSILQRVYLAWEFSTTFTDDALEEASLPLETVRKLETALSRWQVRWESTKESSLRPISQCGTLGFNGTALYRIAHIRLYLNLGAHRRLETRDPWTIARCFLRASKPPRTPQVFRALLQSVHSLSIPVRVGLEYVARTQTLDWSIIHCICNLECALLLTKWLESISFEQVSLCQEERRVIRIISSILDEAGLISMIEDHERNKPTYIRKLAAAVIRLTAETFKGSHVFELMDVLRDSLKAYSAILEVGEK